MCGVIHSNYNQLLDSIAEYKDFTFGGRELLILAHNEGKGQKESSTIPTIKQRERHSEQMRRA